MSTAPAEIFKAYDIRGIVGKTITEEVTENIGRAIGSQVIKAGGSSIVIGRDGRLSGPMLAQALAKGLRQAGVDVIDIGVAPSPVVYFASYEFDIPSCVAITGSHNPPDYNGFKIVVEGTTLSSERIQALKDAILSNDFTSGAGSYESREVIERYIERVVSDVKPAREIKIAIDCGNGVAGATAPTLFRELGCEVIELFSEVDGTFPNHHPDPADPKNLQDLIKAVKENDCEIGLAFDGDGDRLGVITPDGQIIWPDRQMILFAQDIIGRNPGAEIIYDVKCSRTLAEAITQAGGNATMWRTGHSFIKAKLKETGAAIAGEMSGHIFFKERWYGFDDGVYAGARLIELLSNKNESPQAIFDKLPNTVNTPELHIDFAQFGEHYEFMTKLAESANFPGATINTMDGLRADYDDGFGLIRPSNTTPKLVIRFEGDTQEAIDRIQTDFRNLVNSVSNEVTIPF
jgi:phosphomannomutase/phosphoglucomutase